MWYDKNNLDTPKSCSNRFSGISIRIFTMVIIIGTIYWLLPIIWWFQTCFGPSFRGIWIRLLYILIEKLSIEGCFYQKIQIQIWPCLQNHLEGANSWTTNWNEHFNPVLRLSNVYQYEMYFQILIPLCWSEFPWRIDTFFWFGCLWNAGISRYLICLVNLSDVPHSFYFIMNHWFSSNMKIYIYITDHKNGSFKLKQL